MKILRALTFGDIVFLAALLSLLSALGWVIWTSR